MRKATNQKSMHKVGKCRKRSQHEKQETFGSQEGGFHKKGEGKSSQNYKDIFSKTEKTKVSLKVGGHSFQMKEKACHWKRRKVPNSIHEGELVEASGKHEE